MRRSTVGVPEFASLQHRRVGRGLVVGMRVSVAILVVLSVSVRMRMRAMVSMCVPVVMSVIVGMPVVVGGGTSRDQRTETLLKEHRTHPKDDQAGGKLHDREEPIGKNGLGGKQRDEAEGKYS